MGSANAEQTIVLVTGANQGLGFETVKMLAREQPNYVLLLGSRDYAKGQKTAAAITDFAEGSKVEVVELDGSSEDSVVAAAEQVSSKYGRLDVLFNNAGIGVPRASTRESWAEVISVNATSPYFVTKAFVPLLEKAAVPRVTFMSSSLGSVALTLDPNDPFYVFLTGPYAVSKTAMNMVAIQLAREYEGKGFKVNVIDPGYRQTNLNGYSERAGKVEGGAVEACRIIAQGKDGQYNTFTSHDGRLLPW